MRRRDFIKILSVSLAGCVSPGPLQFQKGKSKVVIQPYESSKTGKFGIFSFNFDDGISHHVTTRFSVHDVFYDEKLDEFIGVNKYGPRYLKFKGATFQQLQYFQVDNEILVLSGHVSSVPDAESYYLTGTISKSGQSCILSMNKKDGYCSVAAELPVSDPPAHDCKFGPDLKNLIVTSAKNIYFYDWQAKILNHKSAVLASSDSSVRHFSVSANSDLCLQSNVIHTEGEWKYEKAEIILDSKNGSTGVLVSEIENKIKDNEILDLSFDKTGQVFACVHGRSPFLTIWKTSPLKATKVIQFEEQISRVSNYFDEPYFLVMAAQNFYLVDSNNFSVKKLNLFDRKLKSHFLYGHKRLVLI